MCLKQGGKAVDVDRDAVKFLRIDYVLVMDLTLAREGDKRSSLVWQASNVSQSDISGRACAKFWMK
jgi:hypothetical protein